MYLHYLAMTVNVDVVGGMTVLFSMIAAWAFAVFLRWVLP